MKYTAVLNYHLNNSEKFASTNAHWSPLELTTQFPSV
uniref:Uncharacterized protein n=1 Tax=Arundo donax TaxID=35708 RepID=A0A0A8Y9S5_ARUDO